jgi:hypothetical protein
MYSVKNNDKQKIKVEKYILQTMNDLLFNSASLNVTTAIRKSDFRIQQTVKVN